MSAEEKNKDISIGNLRFEVLNCSTGCLLEVGIDPMDYHRDCLYANIYTREDIIRLHKFLGSFIDGWEEN